MKEDHEAGTAAVAVVEVPPRRRGGAPGAIAALAAVLAFAAIHWLRAPEPPGFDQSLFAYYGHWLGRGLALYRDLWDSKPPGIFWVYAVAERAVGIASAARCVDALAAALGGILAFRLLRTSGAGRLAAGAAGLYVAMLPSAPPFGGPLVAGQAEALQTPLVLAALLAGRGRRARRFIAAGALLGVAALLKLEAIVFAPLLWSVAPRSIRGRPRLVLWVAAGLLLPVLAATIALAGQGILREAIAAVLVYPRAYWAEVASRSPLGAGLARAAVRLGRGLPCTVVLAVLGASAGRRVPGVGVAIAWFVAALLATTAQRLMSGYHLLLFVPPLGFLAGTGIVRARQLVGRAWSRAAPRQPAGIAGWTSLVMLLALPLSFEMRLWLRHYAPHAAYRRGGLSQAEFLQALGGPGPAWAEAGSVAGQIERARAASDAAGAPRPPATLAAPGSAAPHAQQDALLVWGFAPAVYARSGCPPATRFVFHQTLLVGDSPLSRRWPGTDTRRARLLGRMHDAPPRFVVVVSGDRSGLEPVDSRTELRAFPELEQILTTQYGTRGATRSYELLEKLASD